MQYNVYFNLFSVSEFRRADEANPAASLDEAIDKIEFVKSERDILCVFIEDIHSRVQIYLEDEKYFFQLHMTNEMYETLTDKERILDLLKNMESVCSRPLDFGLSAVGV